MVGFLLERYMDFFLNKFQTSGSGLAIPLGLCFIAAAMAEFFGLALIFAGVGVSAGIIKQEIYSVSVLMSLITTLIAPIFFLNAIQILP